MQNIGHLEMSALQIFFLQNKMQKTIPCLNFQFLDSQVYLLPVLRENKHLLRKQLKTAFPHSCSRISLRLATF